MTAAEYRFKVIARWRVGCIARSVADRREYVGKHHRKP
jgi:hypothetical protein